MWITFWEAHKIAWQADAALYARNQKKAQKKSYPLIHIPYYYYFINLFKNIYILLIVEDVDKWITSLKKNLKA
jgi:hypothetical protein